MTPELKWLSSPDVDLDSFTAADGVPWGFLLQIGLAPPGVDGADSFNVMVCSPEWIAFHYGADAIVEGRFHVLMATYSKTTFRQFLDRKIHNAAAPTWNEVVVKFGQFAEFSS